MRGESDGSSFPNGGLRSTHTAAGYTLWDTCSAPFIREDVLIVPSMFFAWTGDALDEKIPMIRATRALSTQALRLLRVLGDTITQRVHTNVGCEQEFFLIDRSHYLRRDDLRTVGRTVLGAPAVRGQQMEDHYVGRIPVRVRRYFDDLKQAAWRIGVPIETSHNEVAPGQFEVSPIFTNANVALVCPCYIVCVLAGPCVAHCLQTGFQHVADASAGRDGCRGQLGGSAAREAFQRRERQRQA